VVKEEAHLWLFRFGDFVCLDDETFRCFLLVVLLGLARLASAERINQEGRIPGPLPVVTDAIRSNTSNAK
jgi:hypothetical protein